MNEIYVIYTYLSDIYINIHIFLDHQIYSEYDDSRPRERKTWNPRKIRESIFFAKNGRFQIKTFRLSIINHIHIYIYIYSRVSKALAFFPFFPILTTARRSGQDRAALDIQDQLPSLGPLPSLLADAACFQVAFQRYSP